MRHTVVVRQERRRAHSEERGEHVTLHELDHLLRLITRHLRSFALHTLYEGSGL